MNEKYLLKNGNKPSNWNKSLIPQTYWPSYENVCGTYDDRPEISC